MTYPIGYLYPNEFAEPLVWLPVLFSYSLLISGADLLLLAFIAYLFNKLKRTVPVLLVVGLAFYTVVLLGPLADLRNPDRAPLLFSHAQVIPTEAHPGVSLIALQGVVMWPLGFILAALFTLLYFAPANYQRYLATRNPLRKVLSIGIKQHSLALKAFLKILAVVALVPMAFWAIYPASLFATQTSLFIWLNWHTLVPMYFADTFVVATAVAILAIWLYGVKKSQNELSSLLYIHGVAALSVIALLLLQMAIWNTSYGGSPFMSAASHIMEWFVPVIALYAITFGLSLAASRFLPLSLVVPFTGLVAAIVNKWNVIVRAQYALRSGLAFLEPGEEVLVHEVPIMASIVAAGIFLAIILSILFPLERGHD
ncbi:MAG: hypothetical protein QXS00_04785 [Pyrobaculum sp.]|uniref:hypothetical protein n=1 Tax=Pyrobaculum sp. TaxID=2004705 RepID=UPI0031817844